MLTHQQMKEAKEYAASLVTERPGTYQFHQLKIGIRNYMERDGSNFGILPAVEVIQELMDKGEIKVSGNRYYPA